MPFGDVASPMQFVIVQLEFVASTLRMAIDGESPPNRAILLVNGGLTWKDGAEMHDEIVVAPAALDDECDPTGF